MRRILAMLTLLIMMISLSCAEEPSDVKINIDTANASDGYITVIRPDTEKELSVEVSCNGRSAIYPLDRDSVVLPLQFGDGEYTVTLYEIKQHMKEDWDSSPENEYLQIDCTVITAETTDVWSYCRHPNRYVDYNAESPWVQMAERLVGSDMSQLDRFNAITEYIVQNFSFDFIKTVSISDYETRIPDPEFCWETKYGIAQDLSSVACAMLRSQGIPAMLVYGYIGENTPHAWVIALVDDNIVFFDPTARLDATNKSAMILDIITSDLKVKMTY